MTRRAQHPGSRYARGCCCCPRRWVSGPRAPFGGPSPPSLPLCPARSRTDNNDGARAVIAQSRVQARLVTLCAMLPDQHAAAALTVLGCFTCGAATAP